jgi:zinc-ribbon domain
LGGSQGVCVQCGHELKQGSRFCTACGRAVAGTSQENLALTGDQEITAREHAITATMTSPPPADPVRQDPVAAEPMRPARGTYQFAVPAPQSATHGNSPASDGGSRHSPRRPHRWWPLVIPVAAILVGGVTALILFTLRTSHAARPNADGHSSAPPAITTPVNSPTSPPSPPPAEQAASRLAALLAQSASNRVSTDNAVSDVSNCGPGLSQDQQGLENSAASRQQLLSQLADLPGRSALPAQMLQDLTNAWEESVTADQDLAGWAQDESSQGCSQNDQADPHYAAATGPDNRAKADKIAFVGEWNPIAAKYGLTSYQWDQL